MRCIVAAGLGLLRPWMCAAGKERQVELKIWSGEWRTKNAVCLSFGGRGWKSELGDFDFMRRNFWWLESRMERARTDLD